jgi:hypothetical protein
VSDARVTVVPTLGEAEAICALLRSEGIRCLYRGSIGGVPPALPGRWIEIRVDDGSDAERARELIGETS